MFIWLATPHSINYFMQCYTDLIMLINVVLNNLVMQGAFPKDMRWRDLCTGYDSDEGRFRSKDSRT